MTLLSDNLNKSNFVFIRNDAHGTTLQRIYGRQYKVFHPIKE